MIAERHKKTWTAEELRFLRLKYAKLGAEKTAEALGRSKFAVMCKARDIGLTSGRYFTERQRSFIEKNVGILSYEEMAKRTNHSYDAIKTYIWRNGMTRVASDNGRISLSEFARLMGICPETIKKILCKYGFRVYKAGKHSTIDMDEAIEWLKNNPERWNATRCEKWYFEQFDWFAEKHKKDFEKMVEKRWGA